MAIASLSSSLFYDRASAAMTSLTAQADTLNTQLSTGRKLSKASDDVVAYQRLRTIATDAADATASQANITTAQGVLTSADTALTSMTNLLQNASELVVQARTGTLNDTDRAAIASQLSSIADEIAALANGKDTRGQPLFAGSASGDAVTTNADGSHALASGATSTIPIGGGQSVQPSENAAAILGLAGGRNAIDVIAALATTLKAGGDTTDALGSALGDLSTVSTQVIDVQASLGARGARLDLETTRLTTVAADREAVRSGLEDTDYSQAAVQLQKTMTVLQATQASFTKLSALNLFDYLK
ncbi:flagellin [Sphingomonas bacterium]|uniref:flagellin N-terminal helical domain-containing protein n=1 Tax=Sphingomonas bacterium TaxID=1895847 RepID=UPI001576ABB0|nr:flagellin [Sphingomonas bacterium]